MAMPKSEALPAARSEPRSRTAPALESIALRDQIAVLRRSGTRRPCFRRFDHLIWILLSRWWPRWRECLVFVQPATVLRWRRDGWAKLWRYRSSGRWRGGRPRVSREVRGLITRMARENFLWGAPRIHGELRMLGFSVSQATVSRYLPARSRRPTPSWRTFLRNEAMAFGHRDYPVEHSGAEYLSLRVCSDWGRLMEYLAHIARLSAVHWRRRAHQILMPAARRLALRPGGCARGATDHAHRLNTAPGPSWTARGNRLPAAVPMRRPPYEARASPRPRSPATRNVPFRMDQVLTRRRLIPLGFLAPRIIEAIAEGRQPVELTVEALTRRIDLPLLWSAQFRVLGIQ